MMAQISETTTGPELAEACGKALAEIRRLQDSRQSPIVVALDGGSGAGKSTLALLIEKEVDTALIQADDFFAAGIPDNTWDILSVEERYRYVTDLERLRAEAIEPLLADKPAKWHAFDFEAGLRADGTYGMRTDYVQRGPAEVILLDGVFSARPELADLVDLTILVDVPVDERHARLDAREGKDFLDRWHTRWDPVEEYYFLHIRPSDSFDLVVTIGQHSTSRES